MSKADTRLVISHSSTKEWMWRMALYPAVKMDLCSKRSSSCRQIKYTLTVALLSSKNRRNGLNAGDFQYPDA